MNYYGDDDDKINLTLKYNHDSKHTFKDMENNHAVSKIISNTDSIVNLRKGRM